MTLVARDLIADTLQLASLPYVVSRAMEMIHAPDTSASDVGEILAQDPALVARLLRIVNSPFYGFPSHIDTISRAITIIGTRDLTDLILGASAVQAFSELPGDETGFDLEQFWDHSLFAAVVARLLAQRQHFANTERSFVMGLLHDIGELILLHRLPEAMQTVRQRVTHEALPLHVAEREILGFDHGEVGAELMQAWGLPEAFVTVTRHHHQPSAATGERVETATVHIADAIAGLLHTTATGTAAPALLEPGAWDTAGLSPDLIEELEQEARRDFMCARSVILPHADAA
ncbi:MAG TPA: HDOD domain-containing protein [Gammaproteobacteria bacterium]|nr:HDOD domain-containing protein [Gammaproteobacteria bacterium]